MKAGSTAVKTGQVNFCDASGKYCVDIHLLGTAQLTSAGTAVLKFRPGIGSHSYKAVFVGTKSDAANSSSAAALAVTGATGKYPTTTAIAQRGNIDNYTLTATVTGLVNAPGLAAPVGTVSFLDTSNNNLSLGTATLGTATPGLGFLSSQIPATGTGSSFVAVGDFNGDGKGDLAVANWDDGTVTILLGNGNGTFTQATDSPMTVGLRATIHAVGDFNRDGVPDLAASNSLSNHVTILLGKGDGTFTQAANSSAPAGNAPYSVAVGDFNGDGLSDLAVATYGGNASNMLLPTQLTQTATATATGISVAGFSTHMVKASYPGNSNYASSVSGTTSLYAPTATPVISLGTGTYTSVQTVKITDATPGTTIYYTTRNWARAR